MKPEEFRVCCCRRDDLLITLELVRGVRFGDVLFGDVLFGDVLPGEPGRDPDWLLCGDERGDGTVVEYDGGGCKRGVTSERQETRRASND